jgi:hypothetical protein
MTALALYPHWMARRARLGHEALRLIRMARRHRSRLLAAQPSPEPDPASLAQTDSFERHLAAHKRAEIVLGHLANDNATLADIAERTLALDGC